MRVSWCRVSVVYMCYDKKQERLIDMFDGDARGREDMVAEWLAATLGLDRDWIKVGVQSRSHFWRLSAALRPLEVVSTGHLARN